MRRVLTAFGISLALVFPGWAQTHAAAAPEARPSPLASPPSGRMLLPQPNHGGARLDERSWRGGRWHHGTHDGRFGWWWTIGPQWFFYDRPSYPFPDIYGPVGASRGWWYWCDVYQDYYPFVTRCPSGWRSVPPR